LDHALAEQSVSIQQPNHPRGNAARRGFAHETLNSGNRHDEQHRAVELRCAWFQRRHAAGDFHRDTELWFACHRLPTILLDVIGNYGVEYAVKLQPRLYGQRRGHARLWGHAIQFHRLEWGVRFNQFGVDSILRRLESLFQPNDALVRQQLEHAAVQQQFEYTAVQQHFQHAVLWQQLKLAAV
jgi:hypothetical protein